MPRVVEDVQTLALGWDVEEWEIAAHSSAGAQRPTNEDSVLVSAAGVGPQLQWLIGVADGVGGQADGAAASHLTTDLLCQRFGTELAHFDSPKLALLALIRGANAALYHRNANQQVLDTIAAAATTIVAALMVEGEIVIGNVGDSRAYLLQPHRIIQMTTDDFTAAQPGALSQCLGISPSVTPHLTAVVLQPGELLLCSDGLTNELQATEMHAMVLAAARRGTLRQVVQELVAAAYRHGAHDNLSLILVRRVVPRQPRRLQRHLHGIRLDLILLAVGVVGLLLYLLT